MNQSTLPPVILIAILLYLLFQQPFPADDPVWDVIKDSGHIPLFGFIAIAILLLSKQQLGTQKNRVWLHYAIALTLTLLIGIGSELLQTQMPDRNANIDDFFFDIIGATSFLLLAILFDKQIPAQNKLTRPALIIIIALSWLPGVLPVYSEISTQQKRMHYFPSIILPGKLPVTFIRLKNGKIQSGKLPEPFQKIPALKWTTGIKTDWPFIRIRPVKKDWSSFRELQLDIYSPHTGPVLLTLRTDDMYFNHTRQHTRSRTFSIRPGANHLSLPFMQTGNVTAFNKKLIRHIWLALPDPSRAYSLYITRLELK